MFHLENSRHRYFTEDTTETVTISTREAGQLLGVTPATVCDYRRDKLLTGRLVGRGWRIDKASVDRLLRLGTESVRAETAAPREKPAYVPPPPMYYDEQPRPRPTPPVEPRPQSRLERELFGSTGWPATSSSIPPPPPPPM